MRTEVEEMLESSEYQRLQKELLEMQIKINKHNYEIEPWKLILTAMGTGAALTIAFTALATFILLQLGVR